jgi:hypothetical protein
LIPEGDSTLVDYCCLLAMHEHAEANVHNNNGLVSTRAGHLNRMTTGVLKAYGAEQLQPTTYVEPAKEAFRFSVALLIGVRQEGFTAQMSGGDSVHDHSGVRGYLAYASQSSAKSARPPNGQTVKLSPEQLDSLVAPIALYPDPIAGPGSGRIHISTQSRASPAMAEDE